MNKKIGIVSKVVIFIIIFAILNSVMTFVLCAEDSYSEIMWNEYYEMSELDMVYVGSSVCQCSFNPYLIDEILGTTSYNMGTPAQPVDLTLQAIKIAIEEHNIKRVVWGFGYFVFLTENSTSAETSFLRALNKNKTLSEKIAIDLSYVFADDTIGKSKSVNYVFPWVYNHVPLSVNDVVSNVRNKFMNRNSEHTLQVEAENIAYVGRGFSNYLPVIDYSTQYDENSREFYQSEIKEKSVREMQEIGELCEKYGVELIIVNTPRPVFDVAEYGDEYYEIYLWLKELFASYNAEYFDFNLAKPEIFESRPEYYYNYEHLNSAGAQAFSQDFAYFLQMKNEGTDMNQFFYNWEEYQATVNE